MTKSHQPNTFSTLAEQEGKNLSEAVATVADDARKTAEKLGDRAAAAVGTARDAVAERASAAVSSISGAGERLADTLHAAAEKAGPDSLQARSLDAVANGLAEVARGLNSLSLSEVFADARQFARRNPALCTVGGVIAGYALVRMMTNAPDAAAGGDQAPVAARSTAQT